MDITRLHLLILVTLTLAVLLNGISIVILTWGH
jgi:hypothetical protein